MLARFLTLAILGLSTAQALSNEPAPELRAVIDGFSAHRRVAIGYLRTGNLDLAAIEIERMRDRWSSDLRGLPATYANDRALSVALAETEAAIRDSLAVADKGDANGARALLERAAQPLKAWREVNGLRLFSDCIEEAGAIYERLDVHRMRAPNLAHFKTGASIAADAAATATVLRQCDAEAPPPIRDDPEFRRLIDGMLNSLNQMPDVLRQRDGGALHRLLIEQRAFERLLAFRFG